jgi:hypothetical protein
VLRRARRTDDTVGRAPVLFAASKNWEIAARRERKTRVG